MKYSTFEFTVPNIVVIRFLNVIPTVEEFDEYLKELDKLYSRNEKFVTIIDGTNSKFLPSTFRIKQGKWMKDNAEKIKKFCLGQAYIIPSIMAKIILEGVFIITKPNVPYTINTKEHEALQWAKNILANKL